MTSSYNSTKLYIYCSLYISFVLFKTKILIKKNIELNSMFDDLLFLYYYNLMAKIEEGNCANPNVWCTILGCKVDKGKKYDVVNSKWKTLSDGFEYKEFNYVCERCNSIVSLYVYRRWPTKVLTKKICD